MSTDVMFVCRLTSCLSTDEITDRDIRTQMTTGTPGHREYKWRPGHSKRKRPGHRECSISNHHQQSTGVHKWRPGHREYKWRPGHSKRNYRPGHRNTNDDRNNDTWLVNVIRDGCFVSIINLGRFLRLAIQDRSRLL